MVVYMLSRLISYIYLWVGRRRGNKRDGTLDRMDERDGVVNSIAFHTRLHRPAGISPVPLASGILAGGNAIGKCYLGMTLGTSQSNASRGELAFCSRVSVTESIYPAASTALVQPKEMVNDPQTAK